MTESHSLENISLFRNLPAALLQPLQASLVRRSYKPGADVFRHGDAPDFFYIIESGQVDVVVPSLGQEVVLASFESGSFFGELAVFDGQARSATARAVVDTMLICIPLTEMSDFLAKHPPAARQFISAITLRLRSADELLSRLQIQNVNEIADRQMTLGERVADRVARFGGSWTFIISFGFFLVVWMGITTTFLLTSPPDPFPYIFLNLILSCIAALQAPVIMMSQNRQSAKDRLQADQEFQINVRAELAIQHLHRKIDDLRGAITQHFQSRD